MLKLRNFFFKKHSSRRKGKAKQPKADLKADKNNPITAQEAVVEDETVMKQMALKEVGAENQTMKKQLALKEEGKEDQAMIKQNALKEEGAVVQTTMEQMALREEGADDQTMIKQNALKEEGAEDQTMMEQIALKEEGTENETRMKQKEQKEKGNEDQKMMKQRVLKGFGAIFQRIRKQKVLKEIGTKDQPMRKRNALKEVGAENQTMKKQMALKEVGAENETMMKQSELKETGAEDQTMMEQIALKEEGTENETRMKQKEQKEKGKEDQKMMEQRVLKEFGAIFQRIRKQKVLKEIGTKDQPMRERNALKEVGAENQTMKKQLALKEEGTEDQTMIKQNALKEEGAVVQTTMKQMALRGEGADDQTMIKQNALKDECAVVQTTMEQMALKEEGAENETMMKQSELKETGAEDQTMMEQIALKEEGTENETRMKQKVLKEMGTKDQPTREQNALKEVGAENQTMMKQKALKETGAEYQAMTKQKALKEVGADDPIVRKFMQEGTVITQEIEASEGGRTCSSTNFVPDFYPGTYSGKGRAEILDELDKPSRHYQSDKLLKHGVPLKNETTTGNQGAIKAEVEDDFKSKAPQNVQDFPNLGKVGGKCDVKIHIDNDVFLANRQALSRFSSYFSDAFQKEAGTEEQSTYKVIGVSSEAFSVFLEFVYEREFNANPDNLADVIRMVDELSIPELKERCLEKAVQNLLGKQYSPGSWLYGFIVSHLANEFPRACLIDGFFELDFSTICRILSNDDLQTPSEILVFKVALSWINYFIPERDLYMERIMNCVRFPYMTPKELLECLELTDVLIEYSEQMKRECIEVRENIKLAIWIVTSKMSKHDYSMDIPITRTMKSFTGKRQLERKQSVGIAKKSSVFLSVQAEPEVCDDVEPASSHESNSKDQETVPAENCGDIVVLGGYIQYQNYSQNKQVKLVQSYAPLENRWSHCTKLPEPRFHHAAAMLNGRLYLTGGSDPKRGDDLPIPFNKASKDVFVFNFEIRKWKQIASMNTARMYHTIYSLDGKLYVIGGKDEKSRVLRSVECYNPKVNKWVFVESMLIPRLGASAAVLDGKIVVAGGFGLMCHQKDVPVLPAVESYDPELDSWEQNNSLRFPRCHSNLVNVNGNLYLCGGATYTLHGDTRVLTSVTSVDVYNKTKDVWEEKANLSIARHHAGCAVSGGRIYIICGESTKPSQILRSVECYDVTNDVWDNGIEKLRYPARWLSCVTIPENH